MINRKEVLRAIKSFKKFVQYGTVPYLRISGYPNGIGLYGASNDVEASIELSNKGGEHFPAVWVEFNAFAKTVDAMSDELLVIEKTDHGIKISGGFSVEIGEESVEPPIFPEFHFDWKCDVETSNLVLVRPAVSDDITRSHLQKVYVESHFVAATDGDRLSFIGEKRDGADSATIPVVAMDSLISYKGNSYGLFIGSRIVSVFDAKKGEDVQEYEYAVKCVSDGIVLSAKLDGESFPPVEQVIPKNSNVSIVLESKDLLKAMKAIEKIQGKKAAIVRMSIEKGQSYTCDAVFSCGSVKIKVPASCDGEPEDIAFSAKYMIDALTSSSRAKIEMKDPLDPLLVTSGKMKTVISPVRI
jgi:DNA polymerase III sliding clamp (beta) subunit (PCNA family)